MANVKFRNVLADHQCFTGAIGNFGNGNRLSERLSKKNAATAGIAVAIARNHRLTWQDWYGVVAAFELLWCVVLPVAVARFGINPGIVDDALITGHCRETIEHFVLQVSQLSHGRVGWAL
jgi:hypothetical protein